MSAMERRYRAGSGMPLSRQAKQELRQVNEDALINAAELMAEEDTEAGLANRRADNLYNLGERVAIRATSFHHLINSLSGSDPGLELVLRHFEGTISTGVGLILHKRSTE